MPEKVYNQGTITVTPGSDQFEGQGTYFLKNLRKDDVVVVQGIAMNILSLEDNTHGTFREDWPAWADAALLGDVTAIPYYARITWDGPEYQLLLRQVLDFLQGRAAMHVSITDETHPITTGASKLTYRAANTMQISELRGSLSTASASGDVVVDVLVNGVSILSTPLTILATRKTSLYTGTTQPVINNPIILDDDEITIDITSAGSGAVGLKLLFIATDQT